MKRFTLALVATVGFTGAITSSASALPVCPPGTTNSQYCVNPPPPPPPPGPRCDPAATAHAAATALTAALQGTTLKAIKAAGNVSFTFNSSCNAGFRALVRFRDPSRKGHVATLFNYLNTITVGSNAISATLASNRSNTRALNAAIKRGGKVTAFAIAHVRPGTTSSDVVQVLTIG